ncbi:hypothetical protein P152DRAFT_497353 [Eremomyces bilateralis CBS 781.70]|uniref:Uncharacterized protein n=1 Tax=Eremomyces bilateralis CBS 781.70 TaxID=1392243 RepID=A0A6G1FSI4_9PEZI|nr:uncharacterized protein P152DRAFT_497353 [Eremomyces bilateralis CBS 781.70]KAF1808723.1 hypothetical protein P152DRAFT_497353 [Eremomyces bilateralis CBS 781.70]
MAEKNLEAFAAKLDDPNLDVRIKCTVATELRDSIEIWCQGSSYATFVERFIPIFMNLLDGPPVFMSNSPEQRLRLCVLEILFRLPMTPSATLEQHTPRIVDRLMDLVRIENEDNATLCIKTVMDFLRNQPKALADRVQPFLDLIQEMFQHMEQAVKDTFDNPAHGGAQGLPSTPGNAQYSNSPRPGSPVTSTSSADIVTEQPQARPLQKGMQSFKVIAECPIIVVSIFQAHRGCVNKNVRLFVPLIKNVLLLQAQPQERAHDEARAQGKIFTGVCKDIRNRAAFGDFILAQVKTMSFLAYLLRVYSSQLTDFLPTLPEIVIRMLQDCPRERSGARKELLVAIRHIINFNFRKIFLKKIDELLDERTLIGDGLTVYETMRPLAYSMLADLIHHLRDSLSREQIRRTIEVYTKNLHDDFPGTSFQTMSAKLLLNMSECIAKLEPKEDARHFLVMILDAIGDKFAAMNRQYDNAVKLSKSYTPPPIEASAENFLADPTQKPDWDEVDIFNATPIKTSNPRERNSDPVADNKFLFKNLLQGLKNLFYQLRVCNPQKLKDEIDPTNAPANWNEVSFGYNAEEVKVLIKLFHEGIQVFKYYGVDKAPLDSNDAQSVTQYAGSKEEKELLEAFATAFHHIDPATFHEVFQSEIPHLHQMILEHGFLIHIPQFLLASEATSPAFAGMLLQFLMTKIEDIGSSDARRTSTLLRLFKLFFMAVTLFSQQNEPVLLPHVIKIITRSFELSTTAEEPMNYFLLLRNLFRSIGGGRFEVSYNHLLPLLEMILETLNSLLRTARKQQERDIFVELSLTVPARLSNLLPHLSYLMRPLVVALRAGPELVSQGLRTLELCVDNLTADYLDPIMGPVIDELMAALMEHLKPTPYSHFHSHTTMRILGKLGGRNRKFLTGQQALDFKAYADDEPSFDIRLTGSARERALPASLGLEVAISTLTEVPRHVQAKKFDATHKQQAFRLILSQTKLLIGYEHLPDDFTQLVRLQADDAYARHFDIGPDCLMESSRDKSFAKRDAQRDTLRKLLKAIIFATSVPELCDEATVFIHDLARHFTVLDLGRWLAYAKHGSKPFDAKAGEGPLFIDTRVIADAIADSLASDSLDTRKTAETMLETIRDAAAAIFGPGRAAEKLPLFKHFGRLFAHRCHEEEWFTKAGGTLGIEILSNRLDFSDDWLRERQQDFVRALMYVLKDMPHDVSSTTRTQALDALLATVTRCNRKAEKKDLSDPKSSLSVLCSFLIFELAHMSKHVRNAAQKAFTVLNETTGIGTHELIRPFKDKVLQTIFLKPLRALPFGTQIGYIEAVTFFLSLGHSLVDFNDHLNRLLMESLALADADDETLASKPLEHRSAESIVRLRVACIKLLSTAQGFAEFGSSPPNQQRTRVIAVFFKSLYSKAPDVVEAAYTGLSGVLVTTNKLPKDLLHSGLKPILMNLQDPKKITVEGLEVLARLLKLLTSYFKLEIGSRLLDHMKTIADGPALQRTSFTLIEQHRPMKVIKAILNIFHLLPPTAVSFLGSLVAKVMELELALRRTRISPFREPLLKYLNRYPKETWDFFAPKLPDLSYSRFFAQLLADPSSDPLREAVCNDTAPVVSGLAAESDGERWPVIISSIHITWSVCQADKTKNFLVRREGIRKALLDVGKLLETRLRTNKIDPSVRLAADQAAQQLVDIFTVTMSQDPRNVDLFFEVVNAVTADELRASPTLFHYIYEAIVTSDAVDFSRSLLMRCIELYAGRGASQKTKTFLFHNVVNPILALDVMRNWDGLFGNQKGTKLMDRAMIDAVNTKLWRPQSMIDTSEETGQIGVDHSRMELLQLTALLLKYHTNLVQDFRKDVIRFGWNFIKLEDVINKHAAYVVVAYFVAHYDTPPKIVMPVYQTLLKAHQNEGRTLVTQALELMAPVLRKRLMGGSESKFPAFARMPKKILTEESHNLQQLISIFNFIVRHPDLFYEAREPLSVIIIPALAKIAQPPSPSNEHKRIAINLISLIFQWEDRAAREFRETSSPAGTKRKADGTPMPRSNFLANPALRMVLVQYLVTFIASLPERYPVASQRTKDALSTQPQNLPNPETSKMAVRLLHKLVSPPHWMDLDIPSLLSPHAEKGPQLIEQNLATDQGADEKPEIWLTRQINTLEIVKILVNVVSDTWLLENIGRVQKLLEKTMRMESSEVQDCLHSPEAAESGISGMVPTIERVLHIIPDKAAEEDENSDDSPGAEFIQFCGTVANEGLSNGHLVSALNVLWTLCKKKPQEVDQHIPAIMKVFQTKLLKDHFSAPPAHPAIPHPRAADSTNATPDPVEYQIQIGLILKTIDILDARMNSLNENRRPFLQALAQLVERSQSTVICTKILELVEKWVFHHTGELFPTMKEKTAVLSKMQAFEQRADPTLMRRFLDLVIRIYEDPKITRSELTVRMEPAFLVGTRAQDVDMRNRFLGIFDRHLTRTASSRINALLASQDWLPLSDTYWLSQVTHLLLGSVDTNHTAQLHDDDFKVTSPNLVFGTYAKDSRIANVIVDGEFDVFMNSWKSFHQGLGDVKVKDILEPLGQLQHTNTTLAHDIWVALFPMFWITVPKDDRGDFEKALVALLTKEFNYRQIDKRPNCVQSLLEGIVRAKPRLKFPPQVMKYLAKTYNAWYTAAHYMEEASINPVIDTASVRESTSDALLELYSNLLEDDLFYGTWRRRCQYVETNAALSYEQIGMWEQAQRTYEAAQIKARTGALPFSQGEYMLWEDHWVICAQKLQQWDVLADFAKHENFNDLYLESTWRHIEMWNTAESREQLESIIKSVSDAPTPRRAFFQAFMSLLKYNAKQETPQDLNRFTDEAIQISIRKWHQLPKRITNAHIPILQNFQNLVELHDASIMCTSLGQTNQANLEVKAQELKLLLGSWRDRLPNFWDDINAWQDLVTWRQHIFHLINNVYLSLLQNNQATPGQANSYHYRGFHETAWIINRFAHVARKHNLTDVCIQQLGRIYTLPNIEIQEAFLKLREQAKCHYQNRAELNQGLEVINNTNLNYFTAQQKAEFFTLKGMFLEKLGERHEANGAFGSALWFEIKHPKAWAEWGRYNDNIFKENPADMERASSAIGCYLEAASTYKNAKSRRLLSRVLWLLSLDDERRTVETTFREFKGDHPTWYWITFIPQLIQGLSRQEGVVARMLLAKIAKSFPQALFFQLRTAREEFTNLKKQQDAALAKDRAAKARQHSQQPKSSPTQKATPDSRPATASGTKEDANTSAGTADGTPKMEAKTEPTPDGVAAADTPKKPWEYAEDIMSTLRTAFPLLALSLETMADQMAKYFKCPPDEDAYRLIVALLNDALSYIGRTPHSYGQDVKLPPSTEANITKFAQSILPAHIRGFFESDFVLKKPTMYEYMQKLRKWRNKFEERLDARDNPTSLELQSSHLSEFKYAKFEDVEVPGQYLMLKDKNTDFVKIERILPNVEQVRGSGVSWRRIRIRGHDGSVHIFTVQHPATKQARREERIMQLFRIFNGTLVKKREARRRNLQFTLPVIVPLSNIVRLIQEDPSAVNLQQIYETYCRLNGINKDDPILFSIEKMRGLSPKSPAEYLNALRLEIYTSIQDKFVPNSVVLDYFQSTYPSFADLWLFRRTFAYQFAALSFMTYIMHMNARTPQKLFISRGTGRVWGSEPFPSISAGKAVFHNPEVVPFRLTPNLQTLMGPLGTEGIFAPSMMALGRCLVEPDGELEMQLAIFVRDEVTFWHTQSHRPAPNTTQLRELVQGNIELVSRRAMSFAKPPNSPNLPANQTVVDSVALAVNPNKLAVTEPLWMGYL